MGGGPGEGGAAIEVEPRAGGFLFWGAKQRKHLGNPQVFRYLEPLELSQSVLAPIYPT